MSAVKYNISVSVGDAKQSHYWDSSEPLPLGYHLRWRLERHPQGLVLRHKSGAHFPLAPEVISLGSDVELKEPDNQSGVPVILKIKEAARLRNVIESDPSESKVVSTWEVFQCAIDKSWIMDSSPIGALFTARVKDQPVFSIKEKDGKFYLRMMESSAKVEGLPAGTMAVLEENNAFRISSDDLEKVVVKTETLQWKFRQVESSAIPALLTKISTTPEPEIDAIWFKKSLRYAATTFLLFLLFAWLLGMPKQEEKPEELNFARVVLSKKNNAVAKAAAQAAGAAEGAKPAPAPAKVEEPKLAQKPKEAPKVVSKAQDVPKNPQQVVAAKPIPVKPAPMSKAVMAAKKLEKSMSGLLQMANSASLLANTSGLKSGSSKNVKEVWGGSNGATQAAFSETPTGGLLNQQNIKVAYTGAVSGNGTGGTGTGGKGYGTNGPGSGIQPGGTGSFLSLSIGDEVPSMIEEGLTRKEVWEVINRHLSEIRYCYERSIIRRPDVEGKLLVAFSIGKTGAVKTSKVKSSTVPDSALDQCIMNRLVEWKFPKPRGNTDVAVTYPFIFKRL